VFGVNMLSWPAVAVINHLVRDAGWAHERLRPFAGRSVRFEIAPASVSLAVEADGRLVPAAAGIEPAAVIRLSAPTLFRLVWLHDESAQREVRIEGDAALASAFTGVLSGLRWDVEEDLSRVVGDVAAHRLAQAGSALFAWQVKTASNLAQALAEYWTEEQPIIASRQAVSEFIQVVDALRDDVDRLEKRIERLASSAHTRDRT
jgi:ubiquinone biosynthesis protein UbiJ